MGVIEVPTPNLDNPRLRIYYRVPPGAAAAKEPLPVLVLASPYNHSALDYCREAGDWMRFADEAGIVIAVPDFYSQRWATVMSPTIAGYGFAQVWSGAALLQGLDRLAERVPIRRDGLLFHGYGEGASWCARFARWRPDLCRAISVHSTSTNPWGEEINGLQSLTKLRAVPFLLTCGEEDNRGDGLTNRYESGVRFTTMARGVGVPVLWRSWPGVPHVPTREMEDLSRAFLRNYARSGPTPPEFIGDRRSWRYYPAGSAAAEAIPVLFREEIASREIARQWGEEGR
jgi:poly(3-hydroxybutyrate) depolymerase